MANAINVNNLASLARSGMASTGTSGGSTSPNTPTFAFEHVAAKLVPFDLDRSYMKEINKSRQQQSGQNRGQINANYALMPITQTGGLVFPYNPTISEGIRVKYDTTELTHSNETYHAFKSTDNVRISLSDCVWTCDTFENAVYALSVLHFFRAYSFMDFGRSRSGRPPTPMWFSAYGNYAYYRVPVLLESASWSFPNDVDYVGIPEFGSTEYARGRLSGRKTSDGKYTWMPTKFTVSDVKLIVQHSPRYWTNWSLDDFRSGSMLRRDGTFHKTRSA